MQKSILITGCSSGIGHDAAQGLRARGWRVFASCRKAGDCDRLRAQGFDSPRIDYTEPASIGAGTVGKPLKRVSAVANNWCSAATRASSESPVCQAVTM